MRMEAENGSNNLLLIFRQFCRDNNTCNKARCFSDSDFRHSSQNKCVCLKFLALLRGWLRDMPTKFNECWGSDSVGTAAFYFADNTKNISLKKFPISWREFYVKQWLRGIFIGLSSTVPRKVQLKGFLWNCQHFSFKFDRSFTSSKLNSQTTCSTFHGLEGTSPELYH